MFRIWTKLVLVIAFAGAAMIVVPRGAHAQAGDQQRAYQAGYQNGVIDHNRNKALNLTTGNWHGINLDAYRQGYQDGYRYQDGGRHDYGGDAQRRGYEAGYQNGVIDRNQNKSLNLKTDNWHGVNLQAYERGYEDGYRYLDHARFGRDAALRDRDRHDDHGHDADPDRGFEQRWRPQSDAQRRAYEAGFNNGVNDHSRNKALNLKTDNWRGDNLEAYRRGYEDGFQGRPHYRD